MPKVISSNIDAVDWINGNLEVAFLNGTYYRYFDVPELLYMQLLLAKSVGKFFNENIKKLFRYEKFEKTVDSSPAQDPIVNEFDDVIKFLESKGLARRETDEGGNLRVVFTGEYVKELANYYTKQQTLIQPVIPEIKGAGVVKRKKE